MKMTRFLFVAVLFATLSLGFASCDMENGNNPDDPQSEQNDSTGNNNKEENPTPDSSKSENNNQGESSSSVSGTENGYDYVDLGLSVKWATCNVGADSVHHYGNYYAWGEVEPKEVYDWSTYKFMDSNINDWNGVNKYTIADGQTDGVWYDSEGNFIGDKKTILNPEDDAAFVNMGGSWRMPTYDEIEELKTKCTWTWTDNYNGTGVVGRIVTSKTNDNHIFLPFAGYRSDSDLNYARVYGRYWSISLDKYYVDFAYSCYISSGWVDWSEDYRYFGLSVRAVCE